MGVDRRGPEALLDFAIWSKKHTAATIDAACQKALKAGARRLKDIQRLIGEPSEQGNFAFAQNHPLIARSENLLRLHRRPPASPTVTNNTLKQYAHTLRLSGLLSRLELRLKEAEANRLPYAQFLEIVFQDEINIREQRTIVRRHKAADFRELRSLDNFDFAFNPLPSIVHASTNWPPVHPNQEEQPHENYQI